MSLKLIQKRLELLTLRMQMFCLDPKWSNFIEIIENPKLCTEQYDVLNFWKKACISKYGELWAQSYQHELLSEEAIWKTQTDLQDMTGRLQTRLRVRPRPVLLDRMWYLFFATGDFVCLKEAYSVGGSGSTLAINAVEMYQKFRNVFENKITAALESDPDYFQNHELAAAARACGKPNPLMDPNVFKKIDVEIESAMSQLRAARDLGEQISPNMQKVLDQDIDQERVDLLKKFMSPENAEDLDETLKQIATEQKKLENLDSKGNPIPKGYVEYTKKREQKELKRVSELFDAVAATSV